MDQNNVRMSEIESECTNMSKILASSISAENLVLFRYQVQATLEVCERFSAFLNEDSLDTERQSLHEPSRVQELEEELQSVKHLLEKERLRKQSGVPNESSMESLVAENENLKAKLKECEARLKAAEDVISNKLGTNLLKFDERQQVELLEAQLKMFKEDFESERKDRERTQARLATVEEMFYLAKKQLEQYESRSKVSNSEQQDRSISHLNKYDPFHTLNRPPLLSRGIYQTDTQLAESESDDIESLSFDLTYDLQTHAAEYEPTKRCTARQTSELLCCPQCMKEFYIDNHLDLIEHIDKCHN